MPGQNNLHTHFNRALHDRIKVVYFEPQQHSISVWLVVAVADGAMMVLHFEAVQLKGNLSLPKQLLICGASMTALATEQTLIPTATCFHIGYGDERLRTHGNQRINSRIAV
jgi:hypothetical protein